MKNDLRLIRNEIVEDSKNKLFNEEKQKFFESLNLKFKELLLSEIQFLFEEGKKNYDIFLDKANIIDYIVTRALISERGFNSLTSDLNYCEFKIPKKGELEEYTRLYLDTIFNDCLKSFEVEKKYNQEKIYNLIYEWLFKNAMLNKNRLLEFKKQVGSIKNRNNEFLNLQDKGIYIDFKEFNKLYTRALREINNLIQADCELEKEKKKASLAKHAKSIATIAILRKISKSI